MQATDIESFVAKQLPSSQVEKAEKEGAILRLKDLRKNRGVIR